MPKILTIDDSSTIRSIISKQMLELGFEVEQAEDGEQGLLRLEEIAVDLILLDVTMPVMDGPTMLAKLRERGDHTPVIMLTSESKRTIVSGAVKLGIEDYILKPFKPEELRAKVQKALGAAAVAAPIAAITRTLADVLVVDDMENVHKKLRSLLPQHMSVDACVGARDALQQCQERIYRVIVLDMVIPDVNSVALMKQMRAFQPQAVMVALALRTSNDFLGEVKAQGFQDALFKPFDPDAVTELLAKHFEVQELVSIEGNALACAGFEGKDDKLDRYFGRLKAMCRESVEKLASACWEEIILDLTKVPLRNDKLVRLVVETETDARKLGISLALVGNPEVKRIMSTNTETANLRFFASVTDARAGA